MKKVIGFIGCGNISQAIIGSIIKSETFPIDNIIASAPSSNSRKMVEEKYGIKTTENNIDLASKSDYIVLAIKSFVYDRVLEEIKDHIKKDAIVISIGAGITSGYLRKNLNQGTKFIRTMTNTPILVGEGMTAFSTNETIDNKDLSNILDIFNSTGKTEVINEDLMNGFTSLCGSSPAYIYMLIEAMADAAVIEGIPRDKAYAMASQSVLGSAKMVLETGAHPGELKDNVCSPAGTTIEAVASLEENGFRKAIIQAIRVCTNKSRSMER